MKKKLTTPPGLETQEKLMMKNLMIMIQIQTFKKFQQKINIPCNEKLEKDKLYVFIQDTFNDYINNDNTEFIYVLIDCASKLLLSFKKSKVSLQLFIIQS